MQSNIRALQVFEAVFRNRSIAKAAEELSITRSAISHQIRYLRSQIGEDLIEKTGRTLTFTPQGEKLAESLSFGFAHIESAVRNSINGQPHALRVAVCTAFGSGWLIPRVRDYPFAKDSELQIKLHAYQPELSDTIADVFFTTTPIRDGYWSSRLMGEDLVAVATPALLNAGNQRLCLITTDLEKRNHMADWREYLDLIGEPGLLETCSTIGASHYSFAGQLAEEGAGVALVPYFVAERRIQSGELRMWNQARMPSGREYFLNVKHARRNELQIKQFVTWVRRAVAASSPVARVVADTVIHSGRLKTA